MSLPTALWSLGFFSLSAMKGSTCLGVGVVVGVGVGVGLGLGVGVGVR